MPLPTHLFRITHPDADHPYEPQTLSALLWEMPEYSTDKVLALRRLGSPRGAIIYALRRECSAVTEVYAKVPPGTYTLTFDGGRAELLTRQKEFS